MPEPAAAEDQSPVERVLKFISDAKEGVEAASIAVEHTLIGQVVPDVAKEGLKRIEQSVNFLGGPFLAVKEFAEPGHSTLKQIELGVEVALALAAKYEVVHGILVRSLASPASEAVAASAAEAGAAAVGGEAAGSFALGSFFGVAGHIGIFILEIKLIYAAENHFHLSDKVSNVMVGFTHSDHISPGEYPRETIYHYLEANLPMPADVRWMVELGLQDHGVTWPQFSEYPLYLRQELNERAINSLEAVIDALRSAIGEMGHWIINDPSVNSPAESHDRSAEPRHHESHQGGSDSKTAPTHSAADHSAHASAASGTTETRTPIGYIEVLTAAGLQRWPYYDAPGKPRARDSDPDSTSKDPDSTGKAVAPTGHATPTAPHDPPQPAAQPAEPPPSTKDDAAPSMPISADPELNSPGGRLADDETGGGGPSTRLADQPAADAGLIASQAAQDLYHGVGLADQPAADAGLIASQAAQDLYHGVGLADQPAADAGLIASQAAQDLYHGVGLADQPVADAGLIASQAAQDLYHGVGLADQDRQDGPQPVTSDAYQGFGQSSQVAYGDGGHDGTHVLLATQDAAQLGTQGDHVVDHQVLDPGVMP